jgi:hypothetical protein
VLQLGKWLLILGIFAAIGYAAHQAGTRLARLDVDRLTRELQALERQRAALEEERARLRTVIESARSMQRALQQRYDAEVPRGALAEVVAGARERLAAGVDAARLQRALADAQDLRRCDGPAISRRFRIGVGARPTEDDSTSFADGMIRVSAVVPAVTENMTRNAVVTFDGLGSGGERSVTGLPAEHAYVLDNRELRLRVSDSQVRGFASATLTTCRLE